MRFLCYLIVAASAAVLVPKKEIELANLRPNPNLNKGRKIIAIGDLHGDYENGFKTLLMAGVVNEAGDWAAHQATFIQVGDILDRGKDGRKLYHLLMGLQLQASRNGGEVILLLGNHEVLNIWGYWDDVTQEEINTYGSVEQRKIEFSSKGELGKFIRHQPAIAMKNRNVFMHGGVKPEIAKYGIHEINSRIQLSLQRGSFEDAFDELLLSDDGPLWYRGFALGAEATVCHKLEMALGYLEVFFPYHRLIE